MPISRPRKALVGVALGVICLWLAMQMYGVGIATASLRLNIPIVLASSALLTFECLMWFSASKWVVIRVAASAGALIFGLVLLIAGIFSFLAGTPSTNIGEVPLRNGRLVAYQTSVPLVSDSVLVQLEIQILPGLYAFQSKALIVPAWGANVRAESDRLLVSYADGNGVQKHEVVSP